MWTLLQFGPHLQKNHIPWSNYRKGQWNKTEFGCCAWQLFDEVPQETVHRPALNLVAVLYYYGAHYSAFLYHAKRRMWVCVDDSYVQEVGSIICCNRCIFQQGFFTGGAVGLSYRAIPLLCSRRHLSYDDCLKDESENCQNCCVVLVVYNSCVQWHTHIRMSSS